MNHLFRHLKAAVSVCSLVTIVLVSGCGGGGGSGAGSAGSGGGNGSTAVTLTKITVSPVNPTVARGTFRQFTAFGTYSDGSTGDVTATATWGSSNPANANAGAGGVVLVPSTATIGGTAVISATIGGVGGNTTLTVGSPTLTSIAITPANPSVTAGLTAALTATGSYSDGTTANISASVSWGSSTPAVASVGPTGVAMGVAAGTSSITASLNGLVSPPQTLTVIAATLTGITISPTAPIVAGGLTQQFGATGTYNNGATGNITGSVTWSSSNIAAATFGTTAGLVTVPLTATVGATSNITASVGGVISNTAVLMVAAPAVTLLGITVSPANPTLMTRQTQQYTATGTFSDGSTANVTNSVNWSSSSSAIANINPATGLATVAYAGVGTAIISAASGAVSGSTIEANVLQQTWMSASSVANTAGVYGTMGVAAATNVPGARFASCSWKDGAGNLWLYGGGGYGIYTNVAPGALGDLWKYNIATGMWTFMSGSVSTNSLAIYGPIGVASSTMYPGGRRGSVSWADTAGNLWLFGGYTTSGTTTITVVGDLNDLWKYNIASGMWTWMSGTFNMYGAVVNASGVYGTQGVAAATNVPGARAGSISWTDTVGNLWLFGGQGADSTGASGDLNDLWKYNITSGMWTWMSGSSLVAAKGVYGTLGVAAATNVPGARTNSHSWIDAAGNLWLFGGTGYDSAGTLGQLNDLWKWDGVNWTWASGGNVVSRIGVYGTLGTAAATNVPGARNGGISWTDAVGNMWLLGGGGFDSFGAQGSLNDLWKWNGAAWTWVSGSNMINAKGSWGALGVAALTNVPSARNYSIPWIDAAGNLWLFGGTGYDSAGTGGYLSDLWKLSP